MAPATRRLAHSHAKEEEVPGTVNLRAAEGDDTGYGQALFPVPAEDPNDPLQWSNTRKTLILITCALYSFLSNSALLGPSVYIAIFAEEFDVTPNTAAGLINYANLIFGLGSIVLVPAYHKFGRRPVMLGTLLLYCGGLLGCSQATTYNGLLAARLIHGFGSGVCEALPVQLVNDIFFLHERGQRIGYYTVCLCFGSTGPLYAGYMLNAGLGWRTFFYVEFAFGFALFLLAFFVVEETTYHRNTTPASTPPRTALHSQEGLSKEKGETEMVEDVGPERTMTEDLQSRRKTYMQTLKFWGVNEKDSNVLIMVPRAFTYFLVPQVLWVVTTYGIYIGLGALTFNFTFPLKITAPPYNWSQLNSGLITIATLIGYTLAIPFTTSSDRLAARLTKRNNMIREAEMRLGVMLPAMLISPAGLIIYGFAAQQNLTWVAYFIGVIMVQFGSYFYFTFTLAYALDSYTVNASEMLIAMNIGKQLISFGMGLDLLEWILQYGYVVMIAGVFVGVLLANNLALVVFMIWGKKIRIAMAKSWLGRLHRRSIKETMVA